MLRTGWKIAVLAAILVRATPSSAADDVAVPQTAPVEVIGTTPVLGSGIDRDKIPSNLRTFSAQALGDDPAAPDIQAVLARRMGAVSLADYQGNALQPSLTFRGFTASPVLGEPQGLAVYQNGMRVNEAFGDVVNWDGIPAFAVDRMQVLPGSNPVFGLNALGGAVSMQMKSGFTAQGDSGMVAGGLHGRAKVLAESGHQLGNMGVYLGAMAMNDDGWRQASPSRTVQGYADLGWRGDTSELGLGLTLASSSLGNNGATPKEILGASWSTPFTTPDNQSDTLAALEMRGSHQIGLDSSLQASAYVRHLRSAVVNGNTSDFQDCGGGLAGFLCDGGGRQLFAASGAAIPTPTGAIAQINRIDTRSDGGGASVQFSTQGRLAGLNNAATTGVSVDGGRTFFSSATDVGSFTSDRVALSSGATLGGDSFTRLRADNLYGGLYATDTLTVAPGLDLTLAGRYNAAELRLHDDHGTALNGDHGFLRFNPSAGLTWKVAPSVTLFTDYSEANRVPSPAELSCADPAQPCRVPNAFAGDPALRQVVSRSVELGARGRLASANGDAKDGVTWSVAGFLSNNQNDIIFVSSGGQAASGYFRNAGYTQRTGLEGSLDGRSGPWTWFASYALVRATFESAFVVNSGANPGADAGGNIQVRPGDAIPGVPLHALKAGVAYQVSERWSVGGDMQAATGVYLRGDEANLQHPTHPYAVFNGETSVRLTDAVTVFGRADNLFNTRFSTAGAYGDASEFGYSATDRFLTPGAPFNLWAGLRVKF